MISHRPACEPYQQVGAIALLLEENMKLSKWTGIDRSQDSSASFEFCDKGFKRKTTAGLDLLHFVKAFLNVQGLLRPCQQVRGDGITLERR
jgi:hypothetical protein